MSAKCLRCGAGSEWIEGTGKHTKQDDEIARLTREGEYAALVRRCGGASG